VAVLLDATLIRGVLLPAAMKLLGDWNWYLPRWLKWLPRFRVEPDLQGQPRPEPARTAPRPAYAMAAAADGAGEAVEAPTP
jgi:RND superfamily putative drug exporter